MKNPFKKEPEYRLCAICTYFLPDPSDTLKGLCQRFPPPFPKTLSGSRCGEFKEEESE